MGSAQREANMTHAQGSFGRVVIAEELTFKSAPEAIVEDCEDAWNEQVVTGVTASIDAVDFKVGAGSAKFDIADPAVVGVLGSEVINIASLANYTHIVAWVKSSIALNANDLQLLLDDTANCASPLETLNIPALAANAWTSLKLTLANPATDISLLSVGLKMAVDKGAFIFHIDDVRAIKDGFYMPFISESFRMSRNLDTSKVIRSSRNPNAPVRGNREIGGDIPTEINPHMGRLFKHLLGSYTRTGAGPYVHTFKCGPLPVGLQIEKWFEDIGKYIRYNGCKIARLTLEVNPDGILPVTWSVMGAKETVVTLPFDGAPTDFGHTPFDGFEATINQGGAPLAIATKVALSYDNDLDGSVFVIGGGGERYSLPAGIAKVNGQVTALFEDLTLYNLAVAHTETSLQVILTKGSGDGTAGNEKLTFNFDEIILKPQAPVIAGPRGVLVELPFEAYYNNDADASAMWIELKNAQANL